MLAIFGPQWYFKWYDTNKQLRGIGDEPKEDPKEVKHDIKSFIARQTESQRHDIAIAESLARDCGKNERR